MNTDIPLSNTPSEPVDPKPAVAPEKEEVAQRYTLTPKQQEANAPRFAGKVNDNKDKP